MADDDTESSAQPGMPGSPGDPNVPEDSPEPKAEPIAPRAQPVTDQDRQNAYIEQLEKNYQESSQRGEKMFAQIQDALGNLMKVANAPTPAPPQGAVAPPPPTEQQKGGLSEFVFNLLKFGALTAIAFGSRGRGFGHNAVYKAAIGSALTGYAAGRKDVADASMRLWEKNREIINDQNKEANANYRALIQDERLALTQKMDILNSLSKTEGDYRMFQASKNQNLMDVHRAIADREKLQEHKEEWERTHKDQIYDMLGKGQMTEQYLAWVHQMSGGKATVTRTSSLAEWRKLEEEHPDLRWSEFLKWHEAEEIRKAGEKRKVEAQASKDVKEGKTEEKPADPEAAAKAAKILEGLVQ